LCVANQCVATRRAFITSSAFTADFGGAGAGDTACQNLANAAGLGGTWMAWVSDSNSSPSARFSRATVPYRLLDGTRVAASYAALASGTLEHGIDRDQRGTVWPTREVWTATL